MAVARRRARVPIEVEARSGQPLGMAPARFLRDYWQKRPLLIRGAFPQFHNAIAANDLAGLACEEAALSRIVLRDAKRDRWTLRNGPFRESDFAKLPASHWTLLVQDVDKWDLDVAALLDEFTFLPAWRIDDVMVSYATAGGGVGPHVDQYDVFLVQGSGRRRWRVSTDPDAPHDFRPDVELKLLKRFVPTHEWILEPGDALYLPPGVPHDGVAVGECTTYSVGMRAPAVAELIIDLAESAAEPLGEESRYRDPDLAPARDAHEIDAAALARARAALSALLDADASTLRAWFGRFITRYRSAHEAAPARRPLARGRLRERLHAANMVRNPWSRVAWARSGRQADLFVAGAAWRCSQAFAKRLAGSREIAGADLLRVATGKDLQVLADLVDAGHFAVVSRGR